jgi:antitoxin component YwqK of YwqJK toxin-antitoxin module
VNLTVLALAATSVFGISVQSQVANSRQSKGLKCTFPKVEIVSRQLFNNNGQTVESPVSLTEYTICDEQRRQLETGELLNGEPDIKSVSRYDENGNEIEHAFYTHDSLTHKSVSRYDKSGRVINSSNDDGSKTFCNNTKARSSCRLVGADGKLQTRRVTTYDAMGREIKRVEFQRGRDLRHRYVYGYDSWGHRNLEADYYRSDGRDRSSRSLFTFDKQGKLLEKLWHDEIGLRTREVYEYNSRADLIRRTEYAGDKSVVEQMTMEYQSYDAKGNWTRAVESSIRSQNGKTTLNIRRVLYRTITYFKSSIASR